ncbi:hypothetical protein FXO37_01491 [Capsicum annuum]|nr:hypothetical protein FXO37_01491 [Capsicum annuum]
MESMFNEADVKVYFKNIEPTRKEISCFCIPKKVGPAGKKLKQQHKGLDEQTPKRTPPPRTTKKLSVRTPIFMPIQQKEKVVSKKKDLNRSASKKSNTIQSPDSSFCSSGDENDFVLKKVFHKFRNEVLQEMKSIRGLVSTRCDAIMNAISEIKFLNLHKKDKDNEDNPPMGEAVETTPHHEFNPNFVHDLYKNSKDTLNTKLIDDNICEAHISDSQFSFSDEVLRSINLDFIKSNLGVEDESMNNKCDAEKIVDTSEVVVETTVNTSAEDESKDNEGAAKKILNLVESNMDNSKLNQQNQSPIHIHVALIEQRKDEQNFSYSQVTILDELLPILNVYLNQERSIIVHPLANKAQDMPMHVSRIKRPSRFKESPFTMNFGSVDAVENKNWFYIMGTPGQSWSDEHIDVCFYYLRKKSKYDSNTSYKYSTVDCNFMNIINSVLAIYRIDDDSLNAGGKEYHLNEYKNGFRMYATVPWHTVDHIFIPINIKAKHHWVLAVISFNDRCIYVYDSLSSAGHDAGVLVEVEKLAEVIPICLVACKFYEKKGIDIATHPNYKSYDKMDLFDVYVVEDLPQQSSASLDCGLYMVTYAECLTFGDIVSPVDFDPDLIRTRYASILWNYGLNKEEENGQSNDEAPMKPPREISLTEDTEVHEI